MQSDAEQLRTSITVPIVMGKETNLGLGLNGDNIVTSVRESSAAARAGVKLGDVILGWQGRALERERLQDILRPAPVHQSLIHITEPTRRATISRIPSSA